MSKARWLTLAAVMCVAAAPPAKRGRGDTSWEHTSREPVFSIRLPSIAWKRSDRPGPMLASFHAFSWGTPVLAGVTSVRRQTLAEFRAVVKDAKAEADKLDGRIGPATLEAEEPTPEGGLRAFVFTLEKADGGEVFTGQAFIWNAGRTVRVIFEGQGKAMSRFFKAREKAEFDKLSRAVFRSVR